MVAVGGHQAAADFCWIRLGLAAGVKLHHTVVRK